MSRLEDITSTNFILFSVFEIFSYENRRKKCRSNQPYCKILCSENGMIFFPLSVQLNVISNYLDKATIPYNRPVFDQ